jgi:hypothetical protein
MAHRGRKNDPLYAARRTLRTGSDLLTDRQTQRLNYIARSLLETADSGPQLHPAL